MILRIDLQGNASYRELQSMVQRSSDHEALHESMGLHVREEVRDHVRGIAQTRHHTAQRLGASPTGFLAEAARAVETAPVTADASGAEFSINHPGMIRALRDVTITPRQAECLAIPVHALAYGRRAADVFDAFDCFIAKGMIMMKNGNDDPIALYKLVRSVRQKQDRSLLPSDEALTRAALLGAQAWVDQLVASTV